jgi:hypothetical protein
MRAMMNARDIACLVFVLGAALAGCREGAEPLPSPARPAAPALAAGDDFRVTSYPLRVTDSLALTAFQFPRVSAAAAAAGLESYFAKYATYPAQRQLSPFDWLSDAHYTAVFLRAHPGDTRGLEGARLLDAFLSPYLRLDAGALFVTYPREHPIRNRAGAFRVLRAPWYSGLGNGFALAGYLELWQATGEQAYKDKADRLAEAYFRRRDAQRDGPWFAYVDAAGYLWFEEYPFPQDPQLHIFNGHNYAIQGLYAYYLVEPSERVRTSIQGALTTIGHYAEDYRVPGDISLGWLAADAVRDYGPRRALRQLGWLYDVSGDPYFAAVRTVWADDFQMSGRPLH